MLYVIFLLVPFYMIAITSKEQKISYTMKFNLRVSYIWSEALVNKNL
jgi:hypothetical protein